MKTATKIYITAAAVLALTIAAAGLWSGYRIKTLERTVDSAKADAETLEQTAQRNEADAAAYRQKIAYLERQLDEFRDIARKQDEKLEKSNSNVRAARSDADRARRTSVGPTDAVKLCAKLAELGHPCE